MFSCEVSPTIEELPNEKDLTTDVRSSKEYKENLKKISLYFGKVFSDKEALQELFSFADIEGNDGEIEVNLKDLLSNSTPNTLRGGNSAIRRAFFEGKSQKLGVMGTDSDDEDYDFDDFNVDDFFTFISEYEISIVAPYLAENFQWDGKQELTLSFFTPDMEQENPDDNFTPGYKILAYDANARTEEYLKYEYVVVDDAYAMENPTIVFGYFYDELDEDISLDHHTPPTIQETPVFCSDLKEDDILTLKMPHFRLHGSLAGWPWTNKISGWIAYVNVFKAPNGTVKLEPNTPRFLAGKKVSRRNASDRKWIQTDATHLIHNWPLDSRNFVIVWGYNKRKRQIDHSVTMSSNGSGSTTTTIKSEEGIEYAGSLEYEKCAILYFNGNNIDSGHGLYNSNYTVYRVGKISTYFTTTHFTN
jgi:hypothetical protein